MLYSNLYLLRYHTIEINNSKLHRSKNSPNLICFLLNFSCGLLYLNIIIFATFSKDLSSLCYQGLTSCGLNIKIRKSLSWVSWVRLSCWSVFHKSSRKSRSAHSANMYPYMFIIVEFFPKVVVF